MNLGGLLDIAAQDAGRAHEFIHPFVFDRFILVGSPGRLLFSLRFRSRDLFGAERG